MNQWRWATKGSSNNNNEDGQARFVVLQKEKTKSSTYTGGRKRKKSNVQPPAPKLKEEIFHQKIKKVELKVQLIAEVEEEFDKTKYYLNASDLTQEELVAIFSIYDVDNKGGIDETEMLTSK